MTRKATKTNRPHKAMTIRQARGFLSIIWIAATGPLIILFAMQTALGKYGNDWEVPWSWLSPLVFPILSLLIAVWTLGNNPIERKPVRSPAIFWGAVTLSGVYLFIIWALVLLEPLSELGWPEIMRSSSWYLGVIQGVVAGALTKFFVEHIN